MGDKPGTLIAFGMVGLGLTLVLPFMSRSRMFAVNTGKVGAYQQSPALNVIALIVLAAIGVCVTHAPNLPWRYLLYGTLICIMTNWLMRVPIYLASCAMALGALVSTRLLWWRVAETQQVTLSGNESFFSLVVMACVYVMLNKSVTASAAINAYDRLNKLIMFVVALLACYLIFSTGLSTVQANTTSWHHWGAYIGPAQLVKAGALPLHDIPVQYGLGPTLLLAIAPQSEIWVALYWLAGLSTLLMTVMLGYLALIFNNSKHPLSVLVALLIVVACSLLWTAYPPELMASLATPSTTGIRFMPGVLMLTMLVRHTSRVQIAGHPILPPVWGHVMWLLCILWSPEAGMHATVLWGPYYIWLKTSAHSPLVQFLKAFAYAVRDLIFAAILGLAAFAFIYRVILGEWPRLAEYVVYIIYPPGPLPINPKGSIWFAASCLICWVLGWQFARRENENSATTRSAWLVALLCFSTFTYYLGRSHDNNILNLLPFFALLLQATRAIATKGAVNVMCTTMLAALLGWLVVFGMGNVRVAQSKGKLLDMSPATLANSFNRESTSALFYLQAQADYAGLHPEDAAPALRYIRSTYHESVEIFDMFLLVDGGEVYPPWNALHGPENFASIPSAQRQQYLRRVAMRFKRSGWVLYDKHMDVTEYLADYDVAYSRAKLLEFGTFQAVRFVPK